MKKGYIQSKIYKIKLNIYKQRRKYRPKVKNKNKKRQMKQNKNLEEDRKKKENNFENII